MSSCSYYPRIVTSHRSKEVRDTVMRRVGEGREDMGDRYISGKIAGCGWAWDLGDEKGPVQKTELGASERS